MTLLTIDPSSTCTGYAVLVSATEILEAGLLTASAGRPAWERAWRMGTDAIDLAIRYRPSAVVIELPDGKVHRRIAAASRGAGLSLYGLGAGVVYAMLRMQGGFEIEAVTPAWTGEKSKRERAAELCLRFRGLELDRDRGLDMADAIGLGVWWFERRARLIRSETSIGA